MKIIQVCPRYPPQTGGVETHVKEISERLVNRGHEVVVCSADAEMDGACRETRNGVKICRHRGIAPGGAFHFAPGIIQTVQQLAPDIIHGHNYHAFPLLMAGIGVRGERFVATTHYHGGSPHPVRDQLLILYRPLGRWMLRRAEAVIAVSHWEKNQLKADLGIETTVLPNGVNVDRFEGAEPEDRDRPYLLTVGRLERYKGVQHAIRALRYLPELDLIIVGTGTYRDGLGQIATDEGFTDRIEFLGSVTDERLPPLYAGAHAYLLLSTFEAYGLTVGEALASGTPCVVSTEMALRDWIGRTGVVGVNSFEPRKVAESVKCATTSRPRNLDLPTWDNHVNHLERLYIGAQSDSTKQSGAHREVGDG